MSAELNVIPNFEEIKSVYKMKCKEIHGMEFFDEDFTETEQKHIDRQDEILSSDSWTYSIKHPQKDCRVIKIHSGLWVGHALYRAANQKVEITMRLKEDVIEFAHIESTHDEVKSLEQGLLHSIITLENIERIVDQYLSLKKSGESNMNNAQWVDALMMIKNEQKKISGGT